MLPEGGHWSGQSQPVQQNAPAGQQPLPLRLHPSQQRLQSVSGSIAGLLVRSPRQFAPGIWKTLKLPILSFQPTVRKSDCERRHCVLAP